MTIPREVALVQTEAGIRLTQTAVPELAQLRGPQHSWQNLTISANTLFVPDVRGEKLEIIAEFEVPLAADKLGIRVRVGAGEATTIGYAPKSQTLFVDRTQAGQSDFHEDFAGIHLAHLVLVDGRLRLHLFVDRSTVEVFANDGRVTFSEQIFPSEESVGVELFAGGTAVQVHCLEVASPASLEISACGARAGSPGWRQSK